MMIPTPITARASSTHGYHGGLCRTWRGVGGV